MNPTLPASTNAKSISLPDHLRRTTIIGLVALSILLILWRGIGDAAELSLAWDASLEPDVAGYRLYYGRIADDTVYRLDLDSATECSIGGLEEGSDYFFSVASYSHAGIESVTRTTIHHRVGTAVDSTEKTLEAAATSGDDDSGGGCFIQTTLSGSSQSLWSLEGFNRLKRLVEAFLTK